MRAWYLVVSLVFSSLSLGGVAFAGHTDYYCPQSIDVSCQTGDYNTCQLLAAYPAQHYPKNKNAQATMPNAALVQSPDSRFPENGGTFKGLPLQDTVSSFQPPVCEYGTADGRLYFIVSSGDPSYVPDLPGSDWPNHGAETVCGGVNGGDCPYFSLGSRGSQK